MCILCHKEFNFKNVGELLDAGYELLLDSKEIVDEYHINKRIEELKKEIEERNE